MGFFKEIGKLVSNPVSYVEKNVVQPVVKTVKNVGSSIDDFVNDKIPGGWGTVAIVGGGLAASGLLSGAASTGAAAGGGAAELASVGATGAGLTAPVAVSVPSAFGSAVNSALAGGSSLGSAGAIGTAGFGSALPAAADVAAGLTAGGFAPGTAANLAGMTAAGTGATNLLGGATALAPIAGNQPLAIGDVLKGARLANSLLNPQQPQPQTQPIGQDQGLRATGIDYSGILNLLATRPMTSGLLGTRYQPQSINLTSLLG